MGGGVLEAVRDRVRRLPYPEAHPEDERALVRGCYRAQRAERLGRFAWSTGSSGPLGCGLGGKPRCLSAILRKTMYRMRLRPSSSFVGVRPCLVPGRRVKRSPTCILHTCVVFERHDEERRLEEGRRGVPGSRSDRAQSFGDWVRGLGYRWGRVGAGRGCGLFGGDGAGAGARDQLHRHGRRLWGGAERVAGREGDSGAAR